jgi:hypothetical protein
VKQRVLFVLHMPTNMSEASCATPAAAAAAAAVVYYKGAATCGTAASAADADAEYC